MLSFLLQLLQLLQTRRIISVSKRNVFDAGQASTVPADPTESGNPRLCRICYKMMISLKKAADDLEVRKRELPMK